MSLTTSQAFQWVFDNAEQITVNRRPVAAQTQARDGTVRSITRGGNVWRFMVTVPNGFQYSAIRDYLAVLDYSNILDSGNVQLNNPDALFLSAYSGNASAADIANITATQSSTVTNQIVLGNLSAIGSGTVILAQGDFVQLKSGSSKRASVYTVIDDVVKSGSTANVSLHRSLLNWTGNTTPTYGLAVGSDVRWILRCTRIPQWTVTPNQLVTWDGDFEFVEDLVAGRSGNI